MKIKLSTHNKSSFNKTKKWKKISSHAQTLCKFSNSRVEASKIPIKTGNIPFKNRGERSFDQLLLLKVKVATFGSRKIEAIIN